MWPTLVSRRTFYEADVPRVKRPVGGVAPTYELARIRRLCASDVACGGAPTHIRAFTFQPPCHVSTPIRVSS